MSPGTPVNKQASLSESASLRDEFAELYTPLDMLYVPVVVFFPPSVDMSPFLSEVGIGGVNTTSSQLQSET